MIFDYMNHMMDWNPNGWIFLVLGGAFFLVFIIVLLYILTHDTKNKFYEINELKDNEIKESFKHESIETDGEPSRDRLNFCPMCGERLEDAATFCPFCGSKI